MLHRYYPGCFFPLLHCRFQLNLRWLFFCLECLSMLFLDHVKASKQCLLLQIFESSNISFLLPLKGLNTSLKIYFIYLLACQQGRRKVISAIIGHSIVLEKEERWWKLHGLLFYSCCVLGKMTVTFLKSGHWVTVSINAVAMNLEGQRKKKGNKDRLSSLNCNGENFSKCNVSLFKLSLIWKMINLILYKKILIIKINRETLLFYL